MLLSSLHQESFSPRLIYQIKKATTNNNGHERIYDRVSPNRWGNYDSHQSRNNQKMTKKKAITRSAYKTNTRFDLSLIQFKSKLSKTANKKEGHNFSNIRFEQ